jgi:hypothetical protein
MREIREEFSTNPFEPLELRYVIKHADRLIVSDGSYLELKYPPAAPDEFDAGLNGRALGQCPPESIVYGGISSRIRKA